MGQFTSGKLFLVGHLSDTSAYATNPALSLAKSCMEVKGDCSINAAGGPRAVFDILAAAAAAGPVPTDLPYNISRSAGVPNVSVAIRIAACTAAV